jgi:hypothetical protein
MEKVTLYKNSILNTIHSLITIPVFPFVLRSLQYVSYLAPHGCPVWVSPRWIMAEQQNVARQNVSVRLQSARIPLVKTYRRLEGVLSRCCTLPFIRVCTHTYHVDTHSASHLPHRFTQEQKAGLGWVLPPQGSWHYSNAFTVLSTHNVQIFPFEFTLIILTVSHHPTYPYGGGTYLFCTKYAQT